MVFTHSYFAAAIFKTASSLADYKKKLAKRLKKVQKSYVPPAVPSESNKLAVLHQLKQQYGEDIRFILKHASTAIHAMRIKHGDEKGLQLKQHIDGVKVWAADLGILKNTEPNATISDEQLEKLKAHLEHKRMENILAHVVKLADPDRFLLETMERAETSTVENDSASKLMATALRKKYEQLIRLEDDADPLPIYQKALEQTQVAVPPPTRNARNDHQAALVHLDKMRQASTLLLGWSMVPEKITLPRNNMIKAQTVAKEGISFVANVIKEQRKELGDEPTVSLEDAWMRPLVLPQVVDLGDQPAVDAKRPKPYHCRPVIRSSVLLTSGRKTPSNLLPALKRKRAVLVRPEPRGEGSHLILRFGKAFVMTIYMVPLLVTFRCYTKEDDDDEAAAPTSQSLGCAVSSSLGSGLAEQSELSVWGVKGSANALGRVVRERLRDASAHATHVLRQCFQNLTKEGTAEFELEIREATALLEFIQLARTTYIQDWQDDDS